jgi:hypothetical protein
LTHQDIRPSKPGDALLDAQILDYDLVRQVKDEMNKVKVFRGVYDARFIGTSQHDTATHVLREGEAPTDSEALKCLRADIRYFKWRNGRWTYHCYLECQCGTELRTFGRLDDGVGSSRFD